MPEAADRHAEVQKTMDNQGLHTRRMTCQSDVGF
jgi:hypothetical protein